MAPAEDRGRETAGELCLSINNVVSFPETNFELRLFGGGPHCTVSCRSLDNLVKEFSAMASADV